MKTQQTKTFPPMEAGDTAKPTYEKIARLAHDLYEREGKPDGKHLDHWFNAESMIESTAGYGNDHTEHDFSRPAELNR
jgi:hypothetical protein